MEDKEFYEYAEKEIKLLEAINSKLDKLISDKEVKKPKDEEDEFVNFLNDFAKELGLENNITIKKVVID